MNILVFCLGNICRSPAAEGLLRAHLPDGYVVESAGTSAFHTGSPPDERSVSVCQKHHIDISGLRARQLHHRDGPNFDLFLGMDAQNIRDAKSIFDPEFHNKIRLFDVNEVADPYYDDDGFEKMFVQLQRATDRWCFSFFQK